MSATRKVSFDFKDYLKILIGFSLVPFLPVMVLLSFLLWQLGIVISWFYPDYGKFIGSYDAWFLEEFDGSMPCGSIVTTLTIDGSFSLEELRQIFTTNVLNLKHNSKLRYPELKQYLTKFLGFVIWKNDPHFKLENHIYERSDITNLNQSLNLSKFHEEMHNRPYHNDKSPWEIALLRDVVLSDDYTKRNTLLVVRFHHVMADAKSILKVLVENLGKKPLKTAVPMNAIKSHLHPWKIHGGRIVNSHIPYVQAFSPQIDLNEIKRIARKYETSIPAVINALISGGIRNCGAELRKEDVAAGFPMARPNHPPTFTNHFYLGSMMLPTSEPSLEKRLDKCQQAFLRMKTTGFLKFMHIQGIQGGMLPYFLAKYIGCNHYFPVAITNIAGDDQGFSIGGFPCTDFSMSVGTLPGCAGVGISAFSYKNQIKFSVMAKKNLLSRAQINQLIQGFDNELKQLQHQKHFSNQFTEFHNDACEKGKYA